MPARTEGVAVAARDHKMGQAGAWTADVAFTGVRVPADALEDYVAQAARKRFGYIVEPTRIASWDHRKLLPATA